MAKSDMRHRGYCRSAFHLDGESEGSGSSGQIDTEMTISENSSAPLRKCIELNAGGRDNFGVPFQVISASHMSSSERRGLIHKLRSELEMVRVVQKKVELQTVSAGAVSRGSNIVSCDKGVDGSWETCFRKSSAISSAPGKKLNPLEKGRGNKVSFGKVESSNPASVPNIRNTMLMKQCEALLKRLMSHQHAWVFNSPVDIVKLNIPDYFTIIKHPMDLGTIKKKIASGAYSSPLDFLADVRLTFQNAMTYNPKGNDVHIMADALSNYFEVRWKNIEKKIPTAETQSLPEEIGSHEEMETPDMLPAKRRKTSAFQRETSVEPSAKPVKQVMSNKEKQNLARKLESWMGDIPLQIIDFLRENSRKRKDAEEDEIEIDFDDFSDDTLFALQKLLDDCIQEKHKNQEKVEHCEIELLNDSGPSNSSMPLQKGNEPGEDDVDIGENEPPVTSYPSLTIEKDSSYTPKNCVGSELGKDGGFGNELEAGHGSSLKVFDTLGFRSQLVNETSTDDLLENKQSSRLNQCEQVSLPNLTCMESEGHQDGDIPQCQKQVSPDKQYRAALLKNRFADIILKAQEETLLQSQGRDNDPEKLQREKEELELRKRKEKARLRAEAEAAEDARRRAATAAAEEARQKREIEREAARQALLKMEKTVEIDENSQLLEELEMFRGAPVEHLPSFVDDASPDRIPSCLGGFSLGGSNPLEKLGLFMKEDEEEEEGDPMSLLKLENDVEEGEID